MSLSPDAINQSVFFAALFLTVISVPRLLVLTIRCANRVWIWQDLDRIARSKALQIAAAQDGTSEPVTVEAEDPKLKSRTGMETYGNFTKSIRDPLIEASVAAIIWFLLIPILSGNALWLAGILVIVLGIVVFCLAFTAVLWRDAHGEKKPRPQIRI